MTAYDFDVVIVGSGASGLCAALQLADKLKVGLIVKAELQSGSTPYAQGGIAAVQAADDHVDAHIKDTMIVGRGICEPQAVSHILQSARDAIEWLLKQGVTFSKTSDTDFHLNREAGHSHRRVFHVNDTTGEALSTVLIERVKAHSNISVFENHMAIDLIKQQQRCVGLYVYDMAHKKVVYFSAAQTILATGGANAIYLHTTSPSVSSGDGIAMAYRAGAPVANMEFMQFHPTCLHHKNSPPFLISEAMRGEDASLILPDGTRFMSQFDQRAELAPRDVVARAIHHEMQRLDIPCVYLDISHQPQQMTRKYFPNIYQHCMQLGIDICQQPIPVVPAAHYTCGGVMVDQASHTNIAGLYVIGEAAYTGLHGANRMASNSLIECLVSAMSAAAHILAHYQVSAPAKLDNDKSCWGGKSPVTTTAQIEIVHHQQTIQTLMWHDAGIVRCDQQLKHAEQSLSVIQQAIQQDYRHYAVFTDLLTLRNMAQVAELIVQSALMRKESRGLHYTTDYPTQDDHYQHATVLSKSSE